MWYGLSGCAMVAWGSLGAPVVMGALAILWVLCVYYGCSGCVIRALGVLGVL